MTDEPQGKIVWPIKVGQTVSIEDAYTTLFELSDAVISATFFDETGNVKTNTLWIDLWNGEEPTVFERRSLKDLLEEELETMDDDTPQAKLLSRLLDVLDEYEK